MTSSLNFSPASRSNFSASSPMPLKRIWRAARLERPAAQHLCAGLRHGLGSRKICSRDSTEHGPAITTISFPPTSIPLANLTIVPSGRKLLPASL